MLINPVRNPSIFRRRFPIRSCYPSQHLLRQNPLPRSRFGIRRGFPRAASEPRAVALRRVNARKSFGPNCSLARRMEEEYSAPLRPGPQSQMARAAVTEMLQTEIHRGVAVLSKDIGFGAHCQEETLRQPSTALISAVCFLTDALQGHAPHRSRELAMRDVACKHNNAAGQEH